MVSHEGFHLVVVEQFEGILVGAEDTPFLQILIVAAE